jgi:hypothetical protein
MGLFHGRRKLVSKTPGYSLLLGYTVIFIQNTQEHIFHGVAQACKGVPSKIAKLFYHEVSLKHQHAGLFHQIDETG